MKNTDYINNLIKEKDELKDLCKSHSETILSLNREIAKLKINLSKKDVKIKSLEHNIGSVDVIDNTDTPNNDLKEEYNDLYMKYNELLKNYNELLKKSENNSKPKGGKLRSEYNELMRKYKEVVKKNDELTAYLEEIEKICDSD
jgi:ElaB/YqjD/DUF883 family membrane-anchored ribosome-binding protein